MLWDLYEIGSNFKQLLLLLTASDLNCVSPSLAAEKVPMKNTKAALRGATFSFEPIQSITEVKSWSTNSIPIRVPPARLGGR